MNLLKSLYLNLSFQHESLSTVSDFQQHRSDFVLKVSHPFSPEKRPPTVIRIPKSDMILDPRLLFFRTDPIDKNQVTNRMKLILHPDRDFIETYWKIYKS